MEILEAIRRIANGIKGHVELHIPEGEPDLTLCTIIGEAGEDLRYFYSWALELDKQRIKFGHELVDQLLEKRSAEIAEEVMVKGSYYKSLPEMLQETFWLGLRTQLNFWKEGHLFICSGWRIAFRPTRSNPAGPLFSRN
jgi:hypothetical protein